MYLFCSTKYVYLSIPKRLMVKMDDLQSNCKGSYKKMCNATKVFKNIKIQLYGTHPKTKKCKNLGH